MSAANRRLGAIQRVSAQLLTQYTVSKALQAGDTVEADLFRRVVAREIQAVTVRRTEEKA